MFTKLLKFVFKILGWLIGLLVALLVVGYLTIGFWIKPLINHVAPQFTKTSVTLNEADISLFSGRFCLKGLKVGNPSGFSAPYIFELGEFSVQFQPKSIFTDKIIVDKILIKDTQITAEINQTAQINLMVLNENVQSALDKGSSNVAQTQQEKVAQTTSKSVIIKDLQILNTKLNFAIMNNSSTLKLPDFQAKNIGETKNISLKGSIKLLLEKLTVEPINEIQKSTKETMKMALDKIAEKTKGNKAVERLSNALSDFF